jgi:anti-sigma factor RsiW
MNFPAFSDNSMKQCPEDDVLLDYTAGRLDKAKASLFERHADGCARCASLRTTQAEVWASLDAWKPEPVSAGFNRELWRRIDAIKTPSWSERLAAALHFNLWKRVAPLAVAMGLVVTAYVLDHSTNQPTAPAPQTNAAMVVTATQADQLEQTLDDMQLLHAVDSEVSAKPAHSVM